MRFLLIRNDVLGDAVVSSVLIEVLAKSIDCQINVMCNKYNEVVFRYNPYISNVFISAHQQGTKELAPDYLSVIEQINADGAYDVVFALNPCIRTIKYANLVNTRLIIARKFKTKSTTTNLWFLLHKFNTRFIFIKPKEDQHEVQTLYHLASVGLARLGITKLLDLPRSCKFYLAADSQPKRIANSCIINISGKAQPIKYLNDSLIYALLAKLKTCGQFECLALICTAEDLERAQHIIKLLDLSKQIKIICHDDIMKIAQEIAKYGFFIGGDGGLSHIAAGLGLKCITLFDAQAVENWHPWALTQVSLQTESQRMYDISYHSILAAINHQ